MMDPEEARVLKETIDYCLAKWRPLNGIPPEELEALRDSLVQRLRTDIPAVVLESADP